MSVCLPIVARYGGGDINQALKNTDDPSHQNNFALRYACANGHFNIATTILRDPRILPVSESAADFALCGASVNGFAEVVKMLLDANLNIPEHSRNHALVLACRKGHLNVASALLPVADPSFMHNLAIRDAAGRGHYEIVKLLFADPRVDAHAQNQAALKRAISGRHIKIVKLLLRNVKWYACISTLLLSEYDVAIDVLLHHCSNYNGLLLMAAGERDYFAIERILQYTRKARIEICADAVATISRDQWNEYLVKEMVKQKISFGVLDFRMQGILFSKPIAHIHMAYMVQKFWLLSEILREHLTIDLLYKMVI